MKLTISMATFDDYDGVYFTVQSLRLHQNLSEYDHEILVLDNNPGGEHSKALRGLAKDVKEMRVIECSERRSSFIKYEAFAYSSGDIVLGMDCHVLLKPGFISALVGYWQSNPESRSMVSGPLIYDDLRHYSTHMEPAWRDVDYGTWGSNPQALAAGVPFDIPMQGMGCFSALRNGFPRLNPGFRGFGGEEWYIAEKVRQNGGRVLCHPQLKWMHRFSWPKRTFPLTIGDRLFNYCLGWLEVYGTEQHPMIQALVAHWESKGYGALIAPAMAQAKALLPPLISPEYQKLNAQLHQDASVKFGYRGHEQAGVVKRLMLEHDCHSVLDYGAGKRTLSACLKADGIEVQDYDPSIPEISAQPQPTDLVVCSDVLEHVEPEYLDRVLVHLRSLTKKVLFVRVCKVPCLSKTLPDGSNPHRIVRGKSWWLEQLGTAFDLGEELEDNDQYFSASFLPN
jgi:hypothetical protein